MVSSRFLDDSQIIKKEVTPKEEIKNKDVNIEKTDKEEVNNVDKNTENKKSKKEKQSTEKELDDLIMNISQQNIQNVIPSKTNIIEEQKINSPILNNIVNDVILNNNQTEQYLDVVNDYKKQINVVQPSTNNMLNEVYNELPVYNFSRNQTGGIDMQTLKNPEEILNKIKLNANNLQINNYNNGSNVFLQELRDKCEQDIIKTNLEIEINVEIYKLENNERQRNLINLKLSSFKEQIMYLQLRKNVIEKMLKK